MMKKILAFALAVALIVCAVPEVFAADHHRHWGCDHDEVTITDLGATHMVVCDDCGENLGTEAHDYSWRGTCRDCGHEKENGTACTHARGLRTYKSNGNTTHNIFCADCGKQLSSNVTCWIVDSENCIYCGNAQDCYHTSGNKTYAPATATTHMTKCADCGAVLVASTACTFENGYCVGCGNAAPCKHLDCAVTFVPDGMGGHSIVCDNCGGSLGSEACTYIAGTCMFCNGAEPCAHLSVIYVDCGAAHDMVCDDCGEVLTAGLSHNFSGDYCVDCGAEAPCTHKNVSYVEDGATHKAVCGKCGETQATGLAHNFSGDYCVDCGAEAPCTHKNVSYVDEGATHKSVCGKCGVDVTTGLAHNYGSDHCVDCGAASPCFHLGGKVYGDCANGTHQVVCADCGEVAKTEPHTIKDSLCTKCGAIGMVVTCTHLESAKLYTNIGETTHRVMCDMCGQTLKNAEAHTYVSGVCACGKLAPCTHSNTKNLDNGNGTHRVMCEDCHLMVEKEQTCEYSTKYGLCDCGSCVHLEKYRKCTPLGTNRHRVICDTCNKILDEEAACTPNKGGKCVGCGFKVLSTCKHKNYTYGMNVEIGTHSVICADCHKVVSSNKPCEYKDGECKYCGATEPVPCTHTDLLDYTQDLKNGTHGIYCMGCNELLKVEACTMSYAPCEGGMHKYECECGASKTEAHNPSANGNLCVDCGACLHKYTALVTTVSGGNVIHTETCMKCRVMVTADTHSLSTKDTCFNCCMN